MNKTLNLRILLLSFFFLTGWLQLKAQEKHFVYIQSENKQAFYVRLNNQTYNSTAGGYLILSQLISGKYYFIIGFQDHAIPEQNFILDMTKDAGYSLKKFGDQGWGLFDIVNFTTIMSDNSVNVKQMIGATEKKDSVQAKTDSVTTVKLSTITKSFEKESVKGIDQVYIDQSDNKTDTITVFIPKAEAVAIKRKCIPATKEDFFKTRSDMAASTNDDAMILVAKRYFKSKCYTVEQLKNLGVLFLSEPARYRFFEVAKSSVTDTENYTSLVTQFTSQDWIEKFKALAKN